MDDLTCLIKNAKEDVHSLEILIKKFNPLILKCANIYCAGSYLYLDAVSEGTLALIKALRKYPLDSKIPFPYYAKRAVYSHIKYYTSKEITRIENLISIDSEIKGNENITIEDTLSSEETLEDEFFKKYSTLKILKTIESLTYIEKTVLQRHYFLGHSLKKIAVDIDYSYRGITYARTRGIKKLKEKLEEM